MAGTPTILPVTSVRLPEHLWTEIGLALLAIDEMVITTFAPIRGFFRLRLGDPLFTPVIDGVLSIILTIMFVVGGVLIVAGRRPFGQKHSERAVLGFVLSIFSTLLGIFVIPYFLQASFHVLSEPATFAVTGMVETAVSIGAVGFLTYNIQSRKGRILLWLAAISGLAIAVAFDSQNLQIFPYYSEIVQRTLISLGAVSTALFAAAFLAAFFRIRGIAPVNTESPSFQ